MRCPSCKGLGCSECRSYTMGRITFMPPICFAPEPAHTCPDCMRGLPCNRQPMSDLDWKASQPSLSAAIGAVIDRCKAEPDFRSMETM